MKLVEATVWDYRRFHKKSKVDLSSPLVCVVGANAVGKSSLLDAIAHLDNDEAIRDVEVTRGVTDGAQITARFVLDDDDRAALEDVPEAESAGHLVVTKARAGRVFSIEPEIVRTWHHRETAREGLAAFAKRRAEEREREDPAAWSISPREEEAREVEAFLDHQGPLDPGAIQRIALIQAGVSSEWPEDELPGQLAEFLIEEQREPTQEAIDILRGRIPRILKFGEADRSLETEYDVNADDATPAIVNLLELAATSWAEVQTVARLQDAGLRQTWLNRANAALRREVGDYWKQGHLTIEFHLDGVILKLVMAVQGDELIEFREHSDGLRQFVALRAFLRKHPGLTVDPVILIDEIEMHLHLDAQADLIEVLEEQDLAQKVIYTTHSPGSLPRDLGTGVRSIVEAPRESDEAGYPRDSVIDNHFYRQDRGFAPLLLAMGASAFAFSATRKAVISEGITDALLLPTLIREVTGLSQLGYQVVPGFSEAKPEDVPELDLIASRVVFVADDDEGGAEHLEKLRAGGVLDEQIIILGGAGSSLGLEDLIEREVFLAAVKRELEMRHPEITLDEAAIPDVGRSRALSVWSRGHLNHDGEPLAISKTALAQHVLDVRSEGALVSPAHHEAVASLHESVTERLAVATHRLAVAVAEARA